MAKYLYAHEMLKNDDGLWSYTDEVWRLRVTREDDKRIYFKRDALFTKPVLERQCRYKSIYRHLKLEREFFVDRNGFLNRDLFGFMKYSFALFESFDELHASDRWRSKGEIDYEVLQRPSQFSNRGAADGEASVSRDVDNGYRQEMIEKLRRMTVANGCTPAEAATARKKVRQLQG